MKPTFPAYGENRKPPRGESVRVEPAVPGGSLISSFPSLCLVWAQRARNLAVARTAAAGGWFPQAIRVTSNRSEGASLTGRPAGVRMYLLDL